MVVQFAEAYTQAHRLASACICSEASPFRLMSLVGPAFELRPGSIPPAPITYGGGGVNACGGGGSSGGGGVGGGGGGVARGW